MRLQLALNVKDLDQAIEFYSKMFGVPVAKRKPGYANFSIEDPPLKLVLFEQPDAPERLNHLGIEAAGEIDVPAAIARMKENRLEHTLEDETTCCYATATKVWAHEPQGLSWEWYRILADSETFDAQESPSIDEEGSSDHRS